MEKYDNLGMVGEGSYGMVMKCRNRETGQIVAIKKFLDSEEDKLVKKIAAREIKMLKQLRHDNLVNLLEVFRRKKRLYLVFEFVDHTVLEDLENNPKGLDEMATKKILFQVLRGIEFCHVHNIIHRDIKPENVLVSHNGVVKLCDFGFARTLAAPGEVYTDYVATRWYRAPELLVGDTKYGRAVDIWAIGCLAAEMLTGDPLFPGDSDIDQLHHVVRCLGNLNEKYEHIFQRNPLFAGMRLPVARELVPLDRRLPGVAKLTMNFIKSCLRLDANDRPTSSALLRSEYFTRDSFSSVFMDELKSLIRRETERSGAAPHRTNATSTAQKTTKYELPGKNTTAGAVSVISNNASMSCTTVSKTTTTVTNANSEARKNPVCQSELVEDKSEPVPVKISTENKNKEELPQVPNSPVEYDEKQNPTEVNKSPPPKPVNSPDKESPQMVSSPEQLTPRMTSRHPILDLRLSVELDESPRSNSSPEQETLRLGRAHSPEVSKQMIFDETGSLHPTGRLNLVRQESGVIHDVCAAGDAPVPISDSRVGLVPDKTDRVSFLDPVQLHMAFDNCQSERNYAMPTITQRSIGYLTTTESRTLSKPGVSTSKMFEGFRGPQVGYTNYPSTPYSPVPLHYDTKLGKQTNQFSIQISNRNPISDDSELIDMNTKTPVMSESINPGGQSKHYSSQHHSHPEDKQSAVTESSSTATLPQLPTLVHELFENDTRPHGHGMLYRTEAQCTVDTSQSDNFSGHNETTQSGKMNPLPYELRPLLLPSGYSHGISGSQHNTPYSWDSKKKRNQPVGLYKKHPMNTSTAVSSGYGTIPVPSSFIALSDHSSHSLTNSVGSTALIDSNHDTGQTRENTDYTYHPSRFTSFGPTSYGMGGAVGRSPLLTLTQHNMMRQRAHQLPLGHSVNKYDTFGPTHVFGPQILPINTTTSGVSGVSGSLNVPSSLGGRSLHSNQLSFPGVRASDIVQDRVHGQKVIYFIFTILRKQAYSPTSVVLIARVLAWKPASPIGALLSARESESAKQD